MAPEFPESEANPLDSTLRRFVLAHATQAVVVLDAEGKLLAANRAARELGLVQALFDRSQGENGWLDAFVLELRAAKSASAEVEPRSDPPGKQRFLVEGFAVGEHLVASVRDLAAERLAEAELAHLRKLEAVGLLTAGVIHDFNNLLTPILCLSELLRDEPSLAGPQRQLAEEIGAAAGRAANLTNSLLGFVRGRVERMEQVPLDEVVTAMRPMIERLLGKRIELVLALDPIAGSVLADRQRLEHALLNLVVNARDAMPEGGVLTIEAADAVADFPELCDASQQPAYAALCVRDTGAGMPPEVRERALQPFFTTKPSGRGTGLGLATVQKFVSDSGGRIALHSEEGRGTAVAIALPRTTPAEPETAARPSRQLAGAAGAETVLVVDDDAHVRKAIRASLERERYRVLEASSECDALRIAETRGAALDLVLIDGSMRHSSRKAFLERIAYCMPQAQVVLMSGDAAAIEPAELTAGLPLLRKAFNADALRRAVRAALGAA